MRVDRIASVASFFVSRVDTAVDRLLEERIGARRRRAPRAARAAARQGRDRATPSSPTPLFRERFGGDALRPARARGRTAAAAALGQHVHQEPGLPRRLLRRGARSVPIPSTRCRPRRCGRTRTTATPRIGSAQAVDRARSVLAQLGQFGIDMDAVTAAPRDARASRRSSRSWHEPARHRRAAPRRAPPGDAHEGAARSRRAAPSRARSASSTRDRVGERLWAEDPRSGSGSRASRAPGATRGWPSRTRRPAVAAARGLRARRARRRLHPRARLRRRRRRPARRVLRRALGVGRGGLDLRALDATDPAAVLAAAERGDPARTLYVLCATGSSSAVERAFRVLWERVRDAARRRPRERTSPRSARRAARSNRSPGEHGFRRMFRTPADVERTLGGALRARARARRPSSAPTSAKLLERARRMATACGAVVPPRHNPGLWLGAALGALARSGRDKLTLVAPRPPGAFGDWIEQLVAGATGKDGRGLVPIVGEPLGTPARLRQGSPLRAPPARSGQDRVACVARRRRPPGRDARPARRLRRRRRVRALGDRGRGGRRACSTSIPSPSRRRWSWRPRPRTWRPAPGIRPSRSSRRPPTSPPASARSWRRRAAGAGSRSPPGARARRGASGCWPTSALAIRKRFGVATDARLRRRRAARHRAAPRRRAADRDRARPDGRRAGRPDAIACSRRGRGSRGARDLLAARRRPLLRVHLGAGVDAGLAAVLAALQRRSGASTAQRRSRAGAVAARARASARR